MIYISSFRINWLCEYTFDINPSFYDYINLFDYSLIDNWISSRCYCTDETWIEMSSTICFLAYTIR